MSDKDFAVNDAIHIQLALDADRLVQGEWQVRGEVQPLFCDVHHLTESRGLLLHYKTAPRDRHAKLVALVGHQPAPVSRKLSALFLEASSRYRLLVRPHAQGGAGVALELRLERSGHRQRPALLKFLVRAAQMKLVAASASYTKRFIPLSANPPLALTSRV